MEAALDVRDGQQLLLAGPRISLPATATALSPTRAAAAGAALGLLRLSSSRRRLGALRLSGRCLLSIGTKRRQHRCHAKRQ